MNLRVRWLVFCITGLILVGAGVAVVGEAIIRKSSGLPWFWIGTGGLVVLNGGLSFFGSGVIYRVRLLIGSEEA
ncbi:MAG: hypothetical protein MI724_00200 [Spirochaetales bacterium]|nr:hypothetical protein [Spirochaetales bacterium]